MQILIDGVEQFQQRVFPDHQQLFDRLAKGQQPLALFITCSDSRIDPSLLMQTQPGEVFILRNAGNIVPPYKSAGGEAATIEFAVRVLRVPHIIICGHSRCGAMDGLLHPDRTAELPSLKAWLSHAQATSLNVKQNYGHVADPQALLTAAAMENVLVQLDNLRTHPSVSRAVTRDELQLHGWVYLLESGEVFHFDDQRQEYVPLVDS